MKQVVDENEVLRLYEAGYAQKEIARQLRTHQTGVRRILLHHKVAIRPRPLIQTPRKPYRTQIESEPVVRICRECGNELPIDKFITNGKRHAYICKICDRPYARKRLREWRRTNHRLGITPAEYESLLASQDGQCAICGIDQNIVHGYPSRFAVDHDHMTGAIRGLLCSKCNIGLGYFKDDPKRLLAAIAYLQQNT